MTYESLLSTLLIKTRTFIDLIRSGHYSIIWAELRKRCFSTSISLGLRRELAVDFNDPEARIPIKVRKLKESDTEILLEHGKFAQENPRLAEYQLNLVQSQIPDCYVAVNEDDTPCYMQWLIGSKYNERLLAIFGDTFPPLKSNEALLEAAFMSPSFRGKRIMPAAMSRIAKKAENIEGVQFVNTYVDIQNIPSLKGCKRAGFSPFLLRKDRWRFFRRFVSFEPLPEHVLKQYEEVTG